MTGTPSPSPRELLLGSFQAAISAADPLKIVPQHLPKPPKGKTLVVGTGKARLGDMIYDSAEEPPARRGKLLDFPLPISQRASLKDLVKNVADKAGLPPELLLRKGRLANVVEARDRFIRQAVLEQGYRASLVADFLACHPSNVTRALQKS